MTTLPMFNPEDLKVHWNEAKKNYQRDIELICKEEEAEGMACPHHYHLMIIKMIKYITILEKYPNDTKAIRELKMMRDKLPMIIKFYNELKDKERIYNVKIR